MGHDKIRTARDVITLLSVADIKTTVEPILRGTKVIRLVLFGSYAKQTATEDSDIDLFMFSNGEITGFAFYDIKAKIEEAFTVNTHLLPDLDVIPHSPVAKQISEFGVVVYEREE